MIRLKDLQFAYESGGYRLVVDQLGIEEGERVAWHGVSGSGKTTLLHLVAGILTASSGTVETCGMDLGRLNDSSRRDFRINNIGLVFQEFELLDYLSVLDNILLAFRINRSLTLTHNVRDYAQALAAETGLGELLKRRPRQLSHGQRQRVAICRALATRPKLVLADEPTANLDSDNTNRVLDVLENYCTKENATLVVVTHDSDVCQRFARTVDVAAFADFGLAANGGEPHHA